MSAKRSPWPLWQWLRPVLVFEIVVLACLCGAGVFAQMGLHPDQPGRDSIALLQALAIIFSRLQVLNVLFFLITLVLGARIIYRCAENVRSWAPDNAIAPVWAVAWFAIPIANLFMPLQVVSTLWVGTMGNDSAARVRGALIPLWWITCDAGVVLSLLSEYMLRIVGQPFFLFAALSYASAAISSALFIQIFNTLVRAQHIRVERAAKRETLEAFS